MDVSIIIVSFNTVIKTQKCIQAVVEHTKDIKYEIILSDNGSTDGSVEKIREEFKNVIIIENGHNIGFGKANNTALKLAKGKYILYLNSDAYIQNNAIKMFYDYWENSVDKEHIGAIGAQLIDINGKKVHSAASFPTYRYFCKRQIGINLCNIMKSLLLFFGFKEIYCRMARMNRNRSAKREKRKQRQSGDVGYITGADLFIKNDENAAFNPQYFMYCEETELELKMADKGLKRTIIDGPQIVHDQKLKSIENYQIYEVSDVFKDISGIIYSQNNLGVKARLLRFLVWLNGINPMIKDVERRALQIINESK